MVIGQRHTVGDDDPRLLEHGEEFLRPANAGDGENLRAGEGGDLGAGNQAGAKDRQGERAVRRRCGRDR